MPRELSNPSKVLLAICAIPLAALAALLSSIFKLKAKRSATEVATYLHDFIEGRSGDWDWDDFTSVTMADPQLEDIRRRAAAIELPVTDDGLTILSGLLAEANELAQLEAAA